MYISCHDQALGGVLVDGTCTAAKRQRLPHVATLDGMRARPSVKIRSALMVLSLSCMCPVPTRHVSVQPADRHRAPAGWRRTNRARLGKPEDRVVHKDLDQMEARNVGVLLEAHASFQALRSMRPQQHPRPSSPPFCNSPIPKIVHHVVVLAGGGGPDRISIPPADGFRLCADADGMHQRAPKTACIARFNHQTNTMAALPK